MFYSTEILTDKRYAMSTIWRAANTAPGVRLAGLRRKAVLEVDLARACGTIKDPPGAPIALRLQGTLLYGSARIYQEQCSYVMNDGERIQRAMFKLRSSFLDDKLDRNAGKAKDVQIVLPNDPGFDLGLLQLPAFDFDVPATGSLLSQQRQASWTAASLQSHASNNTLLPQIAIDADSSGRASIGRGMWSSALSGASLYQDSPTPFAQPPSPVEEDNLLADVGLFLDENGNIVERDPRPDPVLPPFAVAAGAAVGQNKPQELFPMIFDDDEQILPPPLTATSQGIAKEAEATASLAAHGMALDKTSSPHSPTSNSTATGSTKNQAATHTQRAHQRVRHKVSLVDEITQIPLHEYFRSVTNYADNMNRASERKVRVRSFRRAKDTTRNQQTAYEFTFGRGIFGIAHEGMARNKPGHPLAQLFSGESLEDALLGDHLSQARQHMAAVAAELPTTPRGRGRPNGRLGHPEEEQDIELGRQPGSALSDNPSLGFNRHSSALGGSSLPGSAQHSAGLSHRLSVGPVGGGGNSAGRRSSPSFIERYSELSGMQPQLAADDDDGFFVGAPGATAHALGGVGATAASTAAPKTGLGGGDGSGDSTGAKGNQPGEEMRSNSAFLALVQKRVVELGPAASGSSSSRNKNKNNYGDKYQWVDFDDLVAPIQNSRPAVVSAFMSLLTLVTTRQLRVQQEELHGDGHIDREIRVGVKRPGQHNATKKRSLPDDMGAARPASRRRLAMESNRSLVRVW